MGGRGGLSASARRAAKANGDGGFMDFVKRHDASVIQNISKERDTYVLENDGDTFNRLRSEGLNGWTAFQAYLDENNDYAKPDIVSQEEFDRLVSEGAQPIYRGMPNSSSTTGVQKLEQVMYADKYYSGRGKYGDGLYFSNDRGTANVYADGYGTGGSVMRAVLKPDANVVLYDKMPVQLRKDYPKVIVDSQSVSAYARSKGYDALYVPDVGNGDDYYVILNRGALAIDNSLETINS